MAGLNKVMLIGRLGKDPESRATPQGTPVARFSLATDESYKDRSGQKVEKTEWHNIIAWGKLADVAMNYLGKGQMVYVEGSIKTDSWDDKETGQKRYRTEINAQQIKMLEWKDRGGASAGDDDFAPKQNTKRGAAPADDEEVPF